MLKMSSLVEKARGDRARIEALIAQQEAAVRRAFRRFLDEMRSDAVRRQVRLALERGGIEEALRVIDSHVAYMGATITQVFLEAGAAAAAQLERQLGARAAHVGITFDPTYQRAAELMRRNTLRFVIEFSDAQRQAVRAALTEALRTGAGPIQTARAFRDSIGLTQYQREVVANYRRALEAGDAATLTRDLRDRRFDPSVTRMLEGGEPLGASRIARMVEQYRNRFLQLRAETIARTETLRTVNTARQEATRQVLDQVGLPSSAVVQTWRATQDERTRDTHAEMDGQEQPLGQPFESPSGALLMYPGDTSLGAGPEEVINCRCVLLTDVAAETENAAV